MLEDKVLLWRLKCGSTRALCRLYSKHESDLLSLAGSFLGRSDQAEDVLQDVFVRFIESLDDFELTGSLKGYLARCVVNRCRDVLRRERLRASSGLDSAEPVASRRAGPLQRVIAGEQAQQVRTALAQLADEQQETILLHLQAGLKFREIAELQRVSAKTVESRYRYGINRLRSLLNGQVEA